MQDVLQKLKGKLFVLESSVESKVYAWYSVVFLLMSKNR